MGASASTLPDEIDKDTFIKVAEGYNAVFFDKNCDAKGFIAKNKLLKLAKKTDVFLSHAWGKDQTGRDNHQRVKLINTALKERGLVTWFDEEQMAGDINDKMAGGIDNASCVAVFVSSNYMDKVGGDKGDDNCKLEFGYACRRKGPERMVPICMETSAQNTKDWEGPVGLALGGFLYVGFTDDASLNSAADQLYSSIIKIIQTPLKLPSGAKNLAPPAPTAAPATEDALAISAVAEKATDNASRGMKISKYYQNTNVRIANESNETIEVYVTGYSGGSDAWYSMEPGSGETWNRPIGAYEGVVFKNLDTEQTAGMLCQAGNCVTFYSFEVPPLPVGLSVKKSDPKDKPGIKLVNNSKEEVDAYISAFSGGSDSWYKLAPGASDTWNRSDGEVVAFKGSSEGQLGCYAFPGQTITLSTIIPKSDMVEMASKQVEEEGDEEEEEEK